MSSKKMEDYFSKWTVLIKEDKLREVMIDTKERKINSKQALEGIVKIGQLAYNHCKKTGNLSSSPKDALNLTLYFNSFFVLEQSKEFIKYLTSIYHVSNFFSETHNLEHMISLYKIIVKLKTSHAKMYHEDGKSLHGPFVHLIQRSILKEVKSESTPNTSVISTMLQLFFELLITDKVLQSGTSFLQTVLQTCHTLSSKDQKAALHLASAGLVQFNKAEDVQDSDTTLPVLLNVYASLLQVQLKSTSYIAALYNLESHLNQAKWKYKDDLEPAQCFGLLSNAVNILMWDHTESDSWLLEKIQHNNKILESLEKLPPADYVKKTCQLMLSIITNFSKKHEQKSVASFPRCCFIPFLHMVRNVANVMKSCKLAMSEVVYGFTEVFVLISKLNSEEHSDRLKECVNILHEIGEETISLLQENISNSCPNVGSLVSAFLSRYSSIVLKYHKKELSEEVILLSKPVCKFICLLPPETIDINNKKASAKLCFTTLICAFGVQRLDLVMECVTMWLSYLPESTDDAFSLLGDMKHNAVAGDIQQHLETTIWTVISERSSNLESDWLPCTLKEAEIASLLMQELITYSINKALRGRPVIAAAEALMDQKTDVFTQVKALVIALDVASVSGEFPDHCLKYHTKSKVLIGKLRKEKKNIDPVDYNCWMANLMYMQLRCFLKDLRSNCETEMVRLSVTVAPSNELPEDRPDPNDTCDLNTRYNSLSLVKQRKLLHEFDSILRHWGFACSLANNTENAEYDWRVTLTFVHEAGALLKLYFDKMNMVKVWELLYSMASLANNVDFTVTAVAELLANNEEVKEEWFQKANEYLNHPDLTLSVKSSFMISSAINHLNNSQIVEGLNLLSTLEPSASKSSIQYTEFLITLGLYQKLKDWQTYNVTFSCSPSVHFSLHKAISYLLYLAEHKKWGGFVEVCQVHQQLLKVSYLLGEVNYALEQPREARCYLKTSLPLAQKLALPLSTVQLVLILAWVDFNTGLTDDCAVKLQSLEDLLELCTTPPSYCNPNSSPSTSPSAKSVMTPPEYLTHLPNCICFSCNNEEYKRLVLETITLRAAFCAEFGSQSHAQQCFQVAMRVEEDLGESKNTEVVMSQARLWLRYGDVAVRRHMMKEALSANTKALKLLTNIDATALYQLALEQKRLIEFSLLDTVFVPKRLFVDTDEKLATPKKTATSINSPAKTFNTPKNSLPVGKSPLATISNNEPITPFARRQKIPFNLPSSGEENTPPPRPLTKSSRTSKVRQQSIVETPVTGKKAVNTPPTNSESKLRTKSKGLPKFLLETPNTMKSATRAKKKPFTVYDDESSISLSEPKNTSSVKKETNDHSIFDNMIEDAVPTKKVLFPQSNSLPVKDSIEDFASLSIVRLSKKTSGLKTYSKSKVQEKTESEFKHPSSITKGNTSSTKTSGQSSSFSFNKMKQAISDVDTQEEVVRKGKLRKGVSASLLKKPSVKSSLHSSAPVEEKRTRSCNIPKEDCDIVEGTPSPPESNRFKIKTRKARSNKT